MIQKLAKSLILSVFAFLVLPWLMVIIVWLGNVYSRYTSWVLR